MDSRTKRGNIPMFAFSLLAFIILLILYFVWKEELAPGEVPSVTYLVSRTLFPSLMCILGTMWLFYALEWGGVVRVKRSLAGGIVVAAVILTVLVLIILALSTIVFSSPGETIVFSEHPDFLGMLYVIYIFLFDNYIGMLTFQLMGFGLFWAMGRRRLGRSVGIGEEGIEQ